MNHLKTKLASVVATSIVLAGCGGGGGTVTQAPAYANYDYTLGTASTKANAESALLSSGAALLPYTAPSAATYSSVAAANTTLNGTSLPIASRDTDAEDAWVDGWTGLGVKVGIGDNFDSNGEINTHGDWVSVIVASVAPEATLSLRQTLSYTSLTDDVALVDAAYTAFKAENANIVNASWGLDKTDYGTGWTSFRDDVVARILAGSLTDPHESETLYIYAAGNGAQSCGSVLTEDCNFYAGAMLGLRNQGYSPDYSFIFVGAVQDGTDTITDYSYQAGDLKNDFIVANDDVLTGGDGSGTSFAAPRVSGAAALIKQKFPNLAHNEIKQLLLLTADDLGDAGVDAVYGHGKLNILNALSPQGVVIP